MKWLIPTIVSIGFFLQFNKIKASYGIYSNGESNIWGVADMQGKRSYMEDKHSILINNDIQLFGVYDGHGNDKVSIYLKDNLLDNIYTYTQKYSELSSNYPRKRVIYNSLFNGFLQTNKNYLEYAQENKFSDIGRGGSTSVTSVIYKEYNNKIHISVANTGDSRGIYCFKNENVVPLSFDHKPDDPKEKKRIEDTGGFVSKAFLDTWRVNGVLAMSRAFGDFDLSPHVIVDPDIIDIEIGYFDKNTNQISIYDDHKPSILLLASDGLWDVYSNEHAASVVYSLRLKGLNPEEISKYLVQSSYDRGSTDNITALVVFVDNLLEYTNNNQLNTKNVKEEL